MKYGTTEMEDITCCDFAMDKDKPAQSRYHYKITAPVRDALAKYYSSRIKELINTEIKLKVVEIKVGSKRILVFRPVPLHDEETELDLNF